MEERPVDYFSIFAADMAHGVCRRGRLVGSLEDARTHELCSFGIVDALIAFLIRLMDFL
ncbi:MAG: hypothetical protein JXR84_27720 [Anaerolineae bacterium]|nr:hypothetical protein [Anaerolineae bacterium]